MRRDSREDTGHSSALEAKRSGTELTAIHLDNDGIPPPHKWWNETGHPVFKSISALARGILRRKNIRDTIHFTADAPNTELLFRTIHSANQLSIYWALLCWFEEFCLKPNERDDLRKVYDERTWANTERSETARSKFFGANSKEWWPRIWKQISGMCSEVRNTEEGCPNLQKFARMRHSFKRASIGMWYTTVADVDDGFGDRTPACREYTRPRADSDSRIYAAIPGRTFIGPVLQDHIFLQFLGTHGIKIQIPSTTTPGGNSWEVICRGKNRFVDELHLRDPGHNPTSGELHLERSIAKESKPLLYRVGAIPHRGSSCDTVQHFDGSSVPFERRYSCWRQEVEWHSCLQVFQRRLSSSPHLKICGNLTALELMGHVAIPCKWKESLFHRGCSFNVTSILTSGLIAGGRESKEGRQTIFFTPLNPFGDNPDEEGPSEDLSKPRKVHYHSEWMSRQDAVYWINLARAQDKGLRLWQTRSHAVIVHNFVPADCIYKVISQKKGTNFIRKTLDASSRTEDCTEECLAIAAAATAAATRHLWECVFSHQATGAESGKRGTR